MMDFADPSDQPADLITAENGHSAQAGTALAIISDNLSCSLGPVRGGWGGKRNRADRVSETLTRAQCAKLIAAARFAESIGLPFNRHWTIHSERAGIQPHDGQSFVRHILKSAGTAARRHGGEMAATWVRENGEGKGEHAHILMHLPRGLTLANRTRRWIVAAGGTYRRNVSRVRSIGGILSSAELADDRYLLNADNVLAYLLKHGDQSAMEALGLPLWGHRGWIMGKRCGSTQNVAESAQNRLGFALERGEAQSL